MAYLTLLYLTKLTKKTYNFKDKSIASVLVSIQYQYQCKISDSSCQQILSVTPLVHSIEFWLGAFH